MVTCTILPGNLKPPTFSVSPGMKGYLSAAEEVIFSHFSPVEVFNSANKTLLTNLEGLPEVSDEKVKKYLLQERLLDEKSARSYKVRNLVQYKQGQSALAKVVS